MWRLFACSVFIIVVWLLPWLHVGVLFYSENSIHCVLNTGKQQFWESIYPLKSELNA
jgi:hypothetical protein